MTKPMDKLPLRGLALTRRGALASGVAALAMPIAGVARAAPRTLTVTEICDRFVDRFAAANPILSGRIFGVGRSGTEVTDWSVAGAERTAVMLRETLTQLDSTPPVSRTEELGAGFLRDNCEAILASHQSKEYLRRVSPHLFIGPPAMLLSSFDLMERHTHGEIPIDRATVDLDWTRIAQRMEAVPQAITGYMQSLQAGLAGNLVASRRMTRAVIDQCQAWSAARWFATYVRQYNGGALTRRLQQAAEASDAVYAECARWMEQAYLPRAVAEDEIGSERFRTAANLWLGIKDLDLDEAYDWATAEYLRLEEEKRLEAGKIRPGVSVDEVRGLLDADPAHSIEGIDAFRDWAQALVDKAIADLGATEFDIPPPMRTCTVQMTETGAGAMPYYLSAPEDGSSPAGVVWPTLNQTRLPTWNAVTTVFHESVPGHHLQLGGSRYLDLTRVQRVGAAAGHAEGWALYAERLMDELGWFDTPATRLGFLSLQSFRAARVIVDIGLHTGRVIPQTLAGGGERWSFERAIDLIQTASGFPRSSAVLEVERYLAWPAQASCYKLGERAWLDARAEAAARAGGSFDRKAWHAAALALGPLGLDRLKVELRKV